MADKGRRLTDKELRKLERDLNKEYETEEKQLRKKLSRTLKMFEALDKKHQRLVDKGKMSQEQYDEWRKHELSHGRWVNKLIDDTATEMLERNKSAAGRINKSTEKVYLQNHNNSMKELERDVGRQIDHTIFKRSTVKRLGRQNAELMPKAAIDEQKDLRWNKQKLTSILRQSIAKGESASQIAERLSAIIRMNKYSAIRSARTMITGAENSALLATFKLARMFGIPIKKVWIAILDEKTRVSHRGLSGEVRELDEPFSNGLMYPGDPRGEPKERFNCRCKLKYLVEAE